MKSKNVKNRIGRSSKSGVIPYLLPFEVYKLAKEARKKRKGDRDFLFILLLFQTGLRISEALALTLAKINHFEGNPVLEILGKGKKLRYVSCPTELVNELKAYALQNEIGFHGKIFPFNRIRGWQIIREAAQNAGFKKRVFPHLLRHSDAIERLKQTGNPKALQHHLGHSSISMVMRYLATITQEESLRIQQKVVFDEIDFS